MKTYLVVTSQVIGSPADYVYAYEPVGEPLADRAEAIRRGVEVLEHDDFSIATIEDGKVVAFGFGLNDWPPEDCDDLAAIQAAVLPGGAS